MGREAADDPVTTAGETTIGSVQNTIRIIEAVVELDAARNVDIAEATGLSEAAVSKHLRTLTDAEFLTRDDGSYRPSFRFLDVGETVRQGIQGVSHIRNALDKLVDETGELAYYIVEEHGRAVVVFRREGREGVNTRSRVGKRLLMHQNAGGKALLAHESRAFVDAVVEDHGLPASTGNTITERDALYEELETVRERGYALNEEESSAGIHAVSAPVLAAEDDVAGACSIVGPKYRVAGDRLHEDLPDLLLTVANELSLNLKHA
jgi:DNA-binding IclR family transcriptional regulator